MTSAATTNDVLPVTTGAYELAELHGVLVMSTSGGSAKGSTNYPNGVRKRQPTFIP